MFMERIVKHYINHLLKNNIIGRHCQPINIVKLSTTNIINNDKLFITLEPVHS